MVGIMIKTSASQRRDLRFESCIRLGFLDFKSELSRISRF